MTEDLQRQIIALEKRLQILETNEVAPVIAKYSTNAGNSIADDTATIVDYEDQIYDSHSLVTTGAAWKFTAGASTAGYYAVAASLMFTATSGWALDEYAQLSLYKNGSVASIFDFKDYVDSTGANVTLQVSGAAIIQLSSTNYIDIRVRQTSGGALAIYSGGAATNYNYICIWKI